MRSFRNINKNDLLDVRHELTNHQTVIPKSKLLSGSVTNKYPIVLDGGKTIIFISDRNKEAEIREKYEMRKVI